jgi:hypothetical protein
MLMNKSVLFAATRFAPRLFQVRRSTWIGAGVGLLVLFALLVWAGLALIGWLFGLARGWIDGAPEAARGVLDQAEQVLPGTQATLGEYLGDLVPTLKPAPPRRDVSGTDLAPVPRYPGMARTFWHREGKLVTIEYEGEADYAAVLDHYAKGFAARGYAQSPRSATPTAETHAYAKGGERLTLTVTRLPKGRVSTHIEIPLR